MAPPRWRQEDLPWDRLNPDRVDRDLVPLIKAAALVEYNANDYAAYLHRVFPDDPGFQAAASDWAVEEVQHGVALGRWAEMVDTTWSLTAAAARFRAGYRIDLPVDGSRRGSRGGELVSRCMVEIGTSSYYTAIADSCDEPVLRQLCRNIAADEVRHFKLFLSEARRYFESERMPRSRRLLIALSRIGETEDDELAYAYYAANAGPDERYDRATWKQAYAARAYARYRRPHVERAATMAAKACGFDPRSVLARGARMLAWWLISGRARRLASA